jgi:hypothetical protein
MTMHQNLLPFQTKILARADVIQDNEEAGVDVTTSNLFEDRLSSI